VPRFGEVATPRAGIDVVGKPWHCPSPRVPEGTPLPVGEVGVGGRIGGNGIAGLRAELKRRSTEPWRNATFFFGFLLNIAFSG